MLIREGKVGLGAFERVLGQVKGRLGVIIDLLRDELAVQQLLRPLVIALGLLQVQPGFLDVREIRGALLLEQLIVQPKQQRVLLDVVADVHRQLQHQAVDLRADGDLLGGGNFTRGINCEVDVTPLDGGSS